METMTFCSPGGQATCIALALTCGSAGLACVRHGRSGFVPVLVMWRDPYTFQNSNQVSMDLQASPSENIKIRVKPDVDQPVDGPSSPTRRYVGTTSANDSQGPASFVISHDQSHSPDPVRINYNVM
jgi:hypothetical protein